MCEGSHVERAKCTSVCPGMSTFYDGLFSALLYKSLFPDGMTPNTISIQDREGKQIHAYIPFLDTLIFFLRYPYNFDISIFTPYFS